MKGLLFGLLFLTGVPSLLVSASTGCKEYAVQVDDTCLSIGKASNATYAQLLSWNPGLNVTCGNLGNQTDDKICISNPLGDYALPTNSQPATTIITTEASIPTPTADQTNSHCGEYYLVALGDDCSTIATNNSITRKDLLFLNPELFENCTNLLADVYYCVQPVGSISTYPGYDGSSTRPPINPVAATTLPSLDSPWGNTTSEAQLIPIANGTRIDCYKYTYFSNLTDNPAADCWSLAIIMGQSAEDFILWNPSLAEGDQGSDAATAVATTTAINSYAYPCTVSANTSYCVMLASPTSTPETDLEPPTPLAAGAAENCTGYYQVASYDSCDRIMARFDLDIDLFYSMNPSIKNDCTGLALGTYYCISIWPRGGPPPDPDDDDDDDDSTMTGTTSVAATGTHVSTPSPIQTGMVSDCSSFYKVKSGDGCYDIANDEKIALDDFYSWNPTVQTDCSGLVADVYVCVGVEAGQTAVPAISTSSRPTTTSSSGGVATPTPTQDGMVSGCKTFYKVQSDDGCWAIANDNSIDLDDFYTWNPAVKTDCSGLQADVYVCIGL